MRLGASFEFRQVKAAVLSDSEGFNSEGDATKFLHWMCANLSLPLVTCKDKEGIECAHEQDDSRQDDNNDDYLGRYESYYYYGATFDEPNGVAPWQNAIPPPDGGSRMCQNRHAPASELELEFTGEFNNVGNRGAWCQCGDGGQYLVGNQANSHKLACVGGKKIGDKSSRQIPQNLTRYGVVCCCKNYVGEGYPCDPQAASMTGRDDDSDDTDKDRYVLLQEPGVPCTDEQALSRVECTRAAQEIHDKLRGAHPRSRGTQYGTGSENGTRVTGWWAVPKGCSIQTRGDWATHFNYGAGAGGSGDSYQAVCKKLDSAGSGLTGVSDDSSGGQTGGERALYVIVGRSEQRTKVAEITNTNPSSTLVCPSKVHRQ